MPYFPEVKVEVLASVLVRMPSRERLLAADRALSWATAAAVGWAWGAKVAPNRGMRAQARDNSLAWRCLVEELHGVAALFQADRKRSPIERLACPLLSD